MKSLFKSTVTLFMGLAMLFSLPAQSASVQSCERLCGSEAAMEKQACDNFRIRSEAHLRLACLKSSHSTRQQCLNNCS